jgi:hypothetical protein
MQSEDIKTQLRACLIKFREGTLQEENLQGLLDSLENGAAPSQQLLYLQASGSSVHSPVIGMSAIQDEDGNDSLNDPHQWPYQTVLDAIRDGWRVIKFPEMALMLHETHTYGLGCEFILEK